MNIAGMINKQISQIENRGLSLIQTKVREYTEDLDLGFGYTGYDIVSLLPFVGRSKNRMYDIYIDDILLPITPSNINITAKNKNKSYDLVNGGEVNLLKDVGLVTITFSAELPAFNYNYARHKDGVYKPIRYYLEKIENLKITKQVFQLIISRLDSNYNLFNSNYTVCLEDYKLSEDWENGEDLKVDFTFKEYKEVVKKTIVDVSKVEDTKHSVQGTEYINEINKINKEDENKKKAIVEQKRTDKKKDKQKQKLVDTKGKSLNKVLRKHKGSAKDVKNVKNKNKLTYTDKIKVININPDKHEYLLIHKNHQARAFLP